MVSGRLDSAVLHRYSDPSASSMRSSSSSSGTSSGPRREASAAATLPLALPFSMSSVMLRYAERLMGSARPQCPNSTSSSVSRARRDGGSRAKGLNDKFTTSRHVMSRKKSSSMAEIWLSQHCRTCRPSAYASQGGRAASLLPLTSRVASVAAGQVAAPTSPRSARKFAFTFSTRRAHSAGRCGRKLTASWLWLTFSSSSWTQPYGPSSSRHSSLLWARFSTTRPGSAYKLRGSWVSWLWDRSSTARCCSRPGICVSGNSSCAIMLQLMLSSSSGSAPSAGRGVMTAVCMML
mmetsp:Transcript_20838/g.52763  ORF Transcript_20838/g.52763 Transcript_20838/m.52763 type:complete len:292 (+) Transcript_20838:1329-2204(+)